MVGHSSGRMYPSHVFHQRFVVVVLGRKGEGERNVGVMCKEYIDDPLPPSHA